MTHPARANAHLRPTAVPTDGSQDVALADTSVQGLQGLRSCLHKMELAQVKMVQEFGEDLLTTSRMLGSGTDAHDWLQVPTTFAGSGVGRLVPAQAAMLSAWTEMQSVVREQMRAGLATARAAWAPQSAETPPRP